MTKLVDMALRQAKPAEKPYRLYDGLGLYMEVAVSGSRCWRLKYRYLNKEKRMSLGIYPEVTLVEARERREAARKLLANGVDPAMDKREKQRAAILNAETTFEVVAREWHEQQKDRWTKDYAANVLNRLEQDIFSVIGRMPIADIKPLQVLDALRRIEKRGAHEVARRMMQTCGQIFRYAVITARTDRNPAADLQGALKPFKKGHYAALEPHELPEFLHALEKNDARLFMPTRMAIKMMLLTFARTGELINSKWDEIDFDNAEWRIPAERMKMRRPHIVPLSHQAIAILREMQELNGKREYIFASQVYPRKPMSNNTILFALGRLGYKGRTTGHGFRALAMSTIKEKLGYRHEVVDRQLAHAPRNKVDAAYDRAQFLDDRKRMMQEWANYIDKVDDTGKVTPLAKS